MARKKNVERKRNRGFLGRSKRAGRKKSGRQLSAYVSQEHDWQAEVPNLRLSRAFGFVLALHVIAVGGILAYEIFKKDRPSPRRGLAAVTASTVGAGAAAAGSVAGTSTVSYRVAEGDTLSTIAAKVGSSVREITRINDFSGGELEQGLILQVPTGGGEKEPRREQASQPVAGQRSGPPAVALPVVSDRPRGSSAVRAAGEAGVERREVAVVEEAGNQVLKARLVRSAPVAATVAAQVNHTVVKGDTLYGLGRRYGVASEAIRRVNGISGNEIRIGQVIRIPQRAE